MMGVFFTEGFKRQLITWRRHFHRYPELSGQEQETAAFIAAELKKLGFEVKEQVAGHGIVAVLPGDEKKKCVALRADMDALPIEEKNEHAYRSQHRGIMHACGHDAHMAMVLGAAKYLSQNPPAGSIKCLFQPSEERVPGGAKFMVAEGALENPKVDAVFATHITNRYPMGTLAFCPGVTMAGVDFFQMRILGKGGHSSAPHLAVDAIAIAAQAINALQTIISRNIAATDAQVLTFSSIHGGAAHNVVPEQVEMTGTLRCLSLETRDKVLALMHKTLANVTEAWGAGYELDYDYGYPPVSNDDAALKLVQEVAEDLPGASVYRMRTPFMSGEDAAYFGLHTPLAFFFTGSGSEKHDLSWHHPSFDIDENALPYGAASLALSAARLAEEDKEG